MERSRAVLTRVASLTLANCLALTSVAGTPQKWDDVPKPVRDTILANGGKAGVPVDKEKETKDGKAIYEAGVKDRKGNVTDLVIGADGKLLETKSDDAADALAERQERAAKLLKGVTFTHPREITNPWLPLATLKRDVIEGSEGGKKTRVVRTVMPDVRRSFRVGDQWVETLVVEDRAFEDGQLAEVAIDYFAQDDGGTVYYFGEDVDEYKDGKVVNHDGSWQLGRDTPVPGVLFPARPKVGARWASEDVSAEIAEKDEIVSVSETVTVPAGTFKDCVKVKESLADGTTEYKYYARGVGVVREVPPEGDELLVTHETK